MATMSQNSNSYGMMNVLNVAGDIKAAQTIASHLSGGSQREREGLSFKNKIYEFEAQVKGQRSKMIMTSVSGHILNYKFTEGYDRWSDDTDDLLPLFDVPVVKVCKLNCIRIKETLEREVKKCDALIIWTNCDREGENIGYQIIQVCEAVNHDVQIYRAKFSTLTALSVQQALNNLGKPNKALSDAIDVRCEIDLRTGFAFSRFQTPRLRNICPKTCGGKIFSYGSCQFPALGFIVERHHAVEDYRPKPFQTIRAFDVRDKVSVEFRWETISLMEDLIPCKEVLSRCLKSADAIVEEITSTYESKERPLPLNTIELIRHCSDVLKFPAKKTMDLALDLYNNGMISYPRTATNILPHDLNLLKLIQPQCTNRKWGLFAQQLLKDGPSPRQETKGNGDQPPIHPTEKIVPLYGETAGLYEFIVRRFLACVSKDAQVQETIVTLKIAGEKFEASGIRTTIENYLEVYPFNKSWTESKIHNYKVGQTFTPERIEIVGGEAPSPDLFTESELIRILAKNQIGTDSTSAEHITKIQSRGYVSLSDKVFKPTKLGLAILDGYAKVNINIGNPDHRADMEKDLQLICEGKKSSADVLKDHVSRYKKMMSHILEPSNLETFDHTLEMWLCEKPNKLESPNLSCPTPAKRPRLIQNESYTDHEYPSSSVTEELKPF